MKLVFLSKNFDVLLSYDIQEEATDFYREFGKMELAHWKREYPEYYKDSQLDTFGYIVSIGKTVREAKMKAREAHEAATKEADKT
jgi:hypothetical protein